MKVVIDISPLSTGHKGRGIGVYTRQLIESLKRVDTKNEYILTSKPDRVRADLIHYPYFDLFFLTLPLLKNIPTVVTVHDVIPLVFPEHYPPGLRGRIKLKIQKWSLNGATRIITDSDQSKNDIAKNLKIPKGKIERVYLAGSHQIIKQPKEVVETIKKRYSLPHNYWLYVGDINYNKNIPGLLRAFITLPPSENLVLVSKAMAGGSKEAEEIHGLIRELHIEKRVIILDKIPQDPAEELAAVYSGASWYVQPSFYEGFGLPVLEAMQCEVPIVASTGGSLPEITRGAALAFEPAENKALEAVLEKAMNLDLSKKRVMIEKGIDVAKSFTWEETARKTIEVYQEALM